MRAVTAETADDWISVLRLSHRWLIEDVRALAVLKLSLMAMDPIDKIIYSSEFSVPEWFSPACDNLASRAETLTFAEAEKIGMMAAVKIFHTREQKHLKICSAPPNNLLAEHAVLPTIPLPDSGLQRPLDVSSFAFSLLAPISSGTGTPTPFTATNLVPGPLNALITPPPDVPSVVQPFSAVDAESLHDTLPVVTQSPTTDAIGDLSPTQRELAATEGWISVGRMATLATEGKLGAQTGAPATGEADTRSFPGCDAKHEQNGAASEPSAPSADEDGDWVNPFKAGEPVERATMPPSASEPIVPQDQPKQEEKKEEVDNYWGIPVTLKKKKKGKK